MTPQNTTLEQMMARARQVQEPASDPDVVPAPAAAALDDVDAVLVAVPEQSRPAAVPTPPAPAQTEVRGESSAAAVQVGDSDVVAEIGALELHAAIKAATGEASMSVFKVAALQSGYTAEMGALGFEDITRLQTASVDAYAARMKLLRTLWGKIKQFSCPPIRFQDWLKQTAQGDYDSLMYGLYAATYPGENEFDVRCRHCGHENKVTAEVGALARVASDDVYGEIRRLLDPKTDFRGAIQNSMVGATVQRKLPRSGIVAEIRNPSIQDYLDNVQWFVGNQDKTTGQLPDTLAGAETIQTLAMYVKRMLVPLPGTSQFGAVSQASERAGLIRRLDREDGRALIDAVDAQSKRLDVSYQLPDFNCGGCGKRNENLFLDFETLLFIKLREKN